MASIGEYVATMSPVLWEAKLVGSIALSIVFAVQLAKMLKRLRYHSAGYFNPSIFSSLLSQYYVSIIWKREAFYSLLLLVFMHIAVFGLAVIHVPILLAILYSTTSFGGKPLHMVQAIDYFHDKYSLLGVAAGLVAIATTLLYASLRPGYKRLGDYVLSLLLVVAASTGIAARILASIAGMWLLGVHAVTGYVLAAYLFSAKRGLHWLESSIATLLWPLRARIGQATKLNASMRRF